MKKNSNEKVIWIINNYASHLEARHLELSKVFAAHGYRVALITSSFHHGKHEYLFQEKITITEREKDVFFVYLKAKPAYSGNGGKRVANMLDFCNEVRKRSRTICEKIGTPSFIIGSSAHPFVWETSYSLSRKYGAKFIAEFRDIWPMSLVDIQGVSESHPFVRLLSLVEKRAYKNADAIVSTMPYAYKHVSDELGFPRNKVFWMPNGINTAEVDAVLDGNLSLPEDLSEYLDNNWCCVYVGSIVKSECLDFILDSWKKVNRKDINLAIIGEGSEKERILSRIESEGMESVKMFSAVRPAEVHVVLSRAKACLAALEFDKLGEYGLSKYKLNDYLYSGKPTVFACNCPNVVADAGHFSLPVNDEELFAKTIERIKDMSEAELEELSQKGKSHIRNTYDYKVIGEKYLNLLEAL